MATPSFAQIQAYSNTLKVLINAAIAEFLDRIPIDATPEEVADLAYAIGRKYKILSSEVGAQWYDWCANMAGVDVERAYLEDVNEESLRSDIDDVLNADDRKSAVENYLTDMVTSTARQTGHSALWREYERGMQGARWARVPVGETCAWCLMLASNGAWYHSEASALGIDPGHYHNHCDCVAVYYADANEIAGYSSLVDYKKMYYEADNARLANDDPSNGYSYPEELRERIRVAREAHDKDYLEAKRKGEKKRKWTKYNEDLIVMRYQNGLEH